MVDDMSKIGVFAFFVWKLLFCNEEFVCNLSLTGAEPSELLKYKYTNLQISQWR